MEFWEEYKDNSKDAGWDQQKIPREENLGAWEQLAAKVNISTHGLAQDAPGTSVPWMVTQKYQQSGLADLGTPWGSGGA